MITNFKLIKIFNINYLKMNQDSPVDLRTSKIIDELNKEFENKLQGDSAAIFLQDKLNDLVKKINEKIYAKCAFQIQKLNKYAVMQENPDKSITLNKNPGQEALADQALVELEECQSNYSQLLSSLNIFSNFAEVVAQKQTDYCINDCINNNILEKDESLKSCVRNCYNMTVSYTGKASKDIIVKQIETIDEYINKI